MKLRTQVATMAAAATLAVGSMANIGWAADAKYVFLFAGDGRYGAAPAAFMPTFRKGATITTSTWRWQLQTLITSVVEA